jgi:hypothetical protein
MPSQRGDQSDEARHETQSWSTIMFSIFFFLLSLLLGESEGHSVQDQAEPARGCCRQPR